MTTTAASRSRRPNLRTTFLGGQREYDRAQAVTGTVRRAPGLYWVKFNFDESWMIARYSVTIVSGQPGWELIGLPFVTQEYGDEETRPLAQPVTVQEISKARRSWELPVRVPI